jgi:hypothetical protein
MPFKTGNAIPLIDGDPLFPESVKSLPAPWFSASDNAYEPVTWNEKLKIISSSPPALDSAQIKL